MSPYDVERRAVPALRPRSASPDYGADHEIEEPIPGIRNETLHAIVIVALALAVPNTFYSQLWEPLPCRTHQKTVSIAGTS